MRRHSATADADSEHKQQPKKRTNFSLAVILNKNQLNKKLEFTSFDTIVLKQNNKHWSGCTKNDSNCNLLPRSEEKIKKQK